MKSENFEAKINNFRTQNGVISRFQTAMGAASCQREGGAGNHEWWW
jgi:hypothetical protein